MMVPSLSSCKKEKQIADVIVYADNIYTADEDNKFITAFAVKDMSVYSAYVRRMRFFSKYYPHSIIMKIWVKSIKKYIE